MFFFFRNPDPRKTEKNHFLVEYFENISDFHIILVTFSCSGSSRSVFTTLLSPPPFLVCRYRSVDIPGFVDDLCALVVAEEAEEVDEGVHQVAELVVSSDKSRILTIFFWGGGSFHSEVSFPTLLKPVEEFNVNIPRSKTFVGIFALPFVRLKSNSLKDGEET